MENQFKKSYDKGFIDGLKAFAYWKDGKQYVGTCGTTLEEAIKNRKEIHMYEQSMYNGEVNNEWLKKYGVDDESYIQIQKCYEKGLNDTEIAEKLDIKKDKVRTWRYDNGLESNHIKKMKSKKKGSREKFFELYKKGYNDAEIARATGYTSSQTVRLWRSKLDLPPVQEKEKSKRLAAIYLKIKRLYEEGKSNETIKQKINIEGIEDKIMRWRRTMGSIYKRKVLG